MWINQKYIENTGLFMCKNRMTVDNFSKISNAENAFNRVNRQGYARLLTGYPQLIHKLWIKNRNCITIYLNWKVSVE